MLALQKDRLSTFVVNCVRLMSNNVAVLRTGIAAFENRMRLSLPFLAQSTSEPPNGEIQF